jgi:hypothetical protein
MSIAWFVVWLVSDLVGGRAPLRFDPPNWWVTTLILAIALDLNRPDLTSRSSR